MHTPDAAGIRLSQNQWSLQATIRKALSSHRTEAESFLRSPTNLFSKLGEADAKLATALKYFARMSFIA